MARHPDLDARDVDDLGNRQWTTARIEDLDIELVPPGLTRCWNRDRDRVCLASHAARRDGRRAGRLHDTRNGRSRRWGREASSRGDAAEVPSRCGSGSLEDSRDGLRIDRDSLPGRGEVDPRWDGAAGPCETDRGLGLAVQWTVNGRRVDPDRPPSQRMEMDPGRDPADRDPPAVRRGPELLHAPQGGPASPPTTAASQVRLLDEPRRGVDARGV